MPEVQRHVSRHWQVGTHSRTLGRVVSEARRHMVLPCPPPEMGTTAQRPIQDRRTMSDSKPDKSTEDKVRDGLHEADKVEPSPDGLDKIKDRIEKR